MLIISLIASAHATVTAIAPDIQPAPPAPALHAFVLEPGYLEAPEGTHHVALAPDAATLGRLLAATVDAPSLGEVMSDGGSYERYPLANDAVTGVSRGAALRLSGRDGAAICSVEGFEMIASSYQRDASYDLAGSVGVGAPCGVPMVLARVRCDDDVEPMFATSADQPAPAWGAVDEAAPEVDFQTRRALMATDSLSAMHAGIAAQAAERGEALRVELGGWTEKIGGRRVQVVQGSFYTGAGEARCGDEDLLTGWSALIVDGQIQAPWSMDWSYVEDLVDIDGDGQFELLERHDGLRVLMSGDREAALAQSPEWCVCGC